MDRGEGFDAPTGRQTRQETSELMRLAGLDQSDRRYRVVFSDETTAELCAPLARIAVRRASELVRRELLDGRAVSGLDVGPNSPPPYPCAVELLPPACGTRDR
jgi:hypothetical protein